MAVSSAAKGREVSRRIVSERAFLCVSALFFAISAAVTIFWCASMSTITKVAIAGLSMGGLQSIETGIVHLGYFRWIGAFSPGVLPAALSDEFRNALRDSNEINENLLLFVQSNFRSLVSAR